MKHNLNLKNGRKYVTILVALFLLVPINAKAQEKLIAGTIVDNSNVPIAGATVVIKGTQNGVISDYDGQFSLEAKKTDTLLVSFVGMSSQLIAVGNKQSIHIVLTSDTKVMDEVVVIGYGTVKKSNLSGAVSTVSSKDISKTPSANLSQALQGNSSGLYSNQSDRAPGANVSLTLRGSNSFSGGNPLFIVDGFPIASGGGINSINPNDIESISILKDASSTAIYGARAANGVILITTKSGKVGVTNLEVEAYTGIKQFNNPIKMMNANQFAQLRRDAFASDGTSMPSNAFLPSEQSMLDNNQSTDWWNEITNETKLTQNYQVSYTSGTDRTKIHVGAGLYSEDGIVNKTKFIRGSLRFNATQKIGERLTISTFNNLSLMSSRGADATNILFPAMVGNPMSPIKDENGEYYAMIQNALGTPRANPVAFTELPTNNTLEPLITSAIALELKLTSHLRLKTQLSGEIDNWRQNFYNPIAISGQDEALGRVSGGYAFITSSVNYNWISETTLLWNRTFKDIHNIDAVIGTSAQQNRWETVTAKASGFSSDHYETSNLGASSGTPIKPGSNLIDWSLLSYIGRVVYTLKDRYILTANMRIDGSSRFGVNNKYGYFPSVAAAWKISEEDFMKNTHWISGLKLRTSYGLSGNANAIQPYQTLARLSYTSGSLNGSEVSGYYQSSMSSPDLKWETTKQFDLGVDFAVLNGQLNVSADYYYKQTNDLIRNISIPLISGFPSNYANLGNMENTGFELGLNSINLSGAFSWKTSLLLSSNKNKLTSLGDGSDRIGTDEWVGKPLGSGTRYMIKSMGIWQTEDADKAAIYGAVPGDVRYFDLDNNQVIDDKDRLFIGSNYPNFYGSLTNDFSYKNFDFNIFVTFSQGRDIYNGNNYILQSGAGVDNNRVEMLDRWTSENPSNKYPRASANGGNRLSAKTSEFLEDGSYIKIKSLTLGYTLPENLLTSIGVKHFRVYSSIVNPFTFTKYSGMDPEDTDLGNTDRAAFYPITTTYLLGLQLKF